MKSLILCSFLFFITHIVFAQKYDFKNVNEAKEVIRELLQKNLISTPLNDRNLDDYSSFYKQKVVINDNDLTIINDYSDKTFIKTVIPYSSVHEIHTEEKKIKTWKQSGFGGSVIRAFTFGVTGNGIVKNKTRICFTSYTRSIELNTYDSRGDIEKEETKHIPEDYVYVEDIPTDLNKLFAAFAYMGRLHPFVPQTNQRLEIASQLAYTSYKIIPKVHLMDFITGKELALDSILKERKFNMKPTLLITWTSFWNPVIKKIDSLVGLGICDIYNLVLVRKSYDSSSFLLNDHPGWKKAIILSDNTDELGVVDNGSGPLIWWIDNNNNIVASGRTHNISSNAIIDMMDKLDSKTKYLNDVKYYDVNEIPTLDTNNAYIKYTNIEDENNVMVRVELTKWNAFEIINTMYYKKDEEGKNIPRSK